MSKKQYESAYVLVAVGRLGRKHLITVLPITRVDLRRIFTYAALDLPRQVRTHEAGAPFSMLSLTEKEIMTMCLDDDIIADTLPGSSPMSELLDDQPVFLSSVRALQRRAGLKWVSADRFTERGGDTIWDTSPSTTLSGDHLRMLAMDLGVSEDRDEQVLRAYMARVREACSRYGSDRERRGIVTRLALVAELTTILMTMSGELTTPPLNV